MKRLTGEHMKDPTNYLKLLLPPAEALCLAIRELLVWVLIGAAIVSGLLEDWVNAAAILAIVFLNGLLGFCRNSEPNDRWQHCARCRSQWPISSRDGTLQSIPAPRTGQRRRNRPRGRRSYSGGLAHLFTIRRIFKLKKPHSPVNRRPCKNKQSGSMPLEVPLADQRNMVFMGTVAVSGKAHGLVVATVLGTELGRIAAMIQKAAEAERVETPLQRRLEQFGYALLWLALGVVTVVFALGYLRGEPLVEMFLISVSLAVAAVPEGLPAVVTITLALGVTRMAKRHALIRKLPAIETLGSATVICTDKTGTLTKNEMMVTRLFVGDQSFEVTGEGYEPKGKIREIRADQKVLSTEFPSQGFHHRSDDSSLRTQYAALFPGLHQLLTAAVLCNGATVQQENGTWRIIGDPTEGALLVAGAKAGLTKAALERRAPLDREIPFDAKRKMITIIRRTEHGRMAYCKGAPDVLLKHWLHVSRWMAGPNPWTTSIGS